MCPLLKALGQPVEVRDLHILDSCLIDNHTTSPLSILSTTPSSFLVGFSFCWLIRCGYFDVHIIMIFHLDKNCKRYAQLDLADVKVYKFLYILVNSRLWCEIKS